MEAEKATGVNLRLTIKILRKKLEMINNETQNWNALVQGVEWSMNRTNHDSRRRQSTVYYIRQRTTQSGKETARHNSGWQMKSAILRVSLQKKSTYDPKSKGLIKAKIDGLNVTKYMVRVGI